jgi:hypothetical protein
METIYVSFSDVVAIRLNLISKPCLEYKSTHILDGLNVNMSELFFSLIYS